MFIQNCGRCGPEHHGIQTWDIVLFQPAKDPTFNFHEHETAGEAASCRWFPAP